MGTPSDHHSEEAEKSVARMLREGQREPLARAKENLKDRLLRKMQQDVLEDLQDTDRVVNEALETLSDGAALRDARDVLKAQLIERLHRDALEAAGREAAQEAEHAAQQALEAGTLRDAVDAFKAQVLETLRQHALEAAGREAAQEAERVAKQALDGEAAQAVKATIKEHLLEQIRQQAVEEVKREAAEGLGTGVDALQGVKDAYKERLLEQIRQQAVEEVKREASARAAQESLGVERDALQGVKEALKQRLLENLLQQAIAEIDDEVDVAPVEAAALPHEEAAAVIDMDLWEEEDGHLEGILDPDADAAPAEAADEGEADEESGFFLSNEPDEPGNASVDASNADPAAGDGSWQDFDPETLAELDPDGAFGGSPDDEAPDPPPVEAEADAPEEAAPEAPEAFAYYLYGIFSGDEALPEALPEAGIDPHYPVITLTHEHIHAVLSRVSLDQFGEAGLAVNLKDAAWTEAHNQAHEALIEQIAAHGTLLPVPFCTVYHSEEQVRDMLSEIAYLDEMERLQGKNQWRLKVYRNRETLHQRVVENSDTVQGLMAEIKSKPRGGAQAVKKKMVATIQEEMALVTDNCTKDVHERLLAAAVDAELGTPAATTDAERGEVILDVTYLVHEDHEQRFQDDVELLRAEYSDLGFDVEVSGPSPPTLFSRFQPVENA